jgi:DNA polymerase (family X)
MENTDIAEKFDEVADLLELQDDNPFRIRSYRQAAQTIRGLGRSVEDMADEDKDLTDLSNIGDGIAKKIHNILQNGSFPALEKARKKIPEGLRELMDVPGVGPKKAMKIHKALDVSSLKALREACEDDKIAELEGFGDKTQEKILKGLDTVDRTRGRMLWAEAREQVEALREILDQMDGIKKWKVAGSYRRGKDTVGDLDVLMVVDDRKKTAEALVDMKKVSETIGRGKEKVSVRLDSGLQVDFRFIDSSQFGAALMYFTGSKAHNIALRRRARDKNWKLSEYGLTSGDKVLAAKTEEAVYKRFGLPLIPPEMREDVGEIDKAETDGIPNLVEQDHIRGDLHCHTDATDGNNTLSEMIDAAIERDYRYIAITDHSQAVSVANGLDEKALEKHIKKICKENEKCDDIWILAGIEVDVLKDGSLDLDTDLLAELDWVVASVHYHREMERDAMTDRIVKAVESGVVHCLGHPLGRMIGRRDGAEMDFDRVAKACAEHDVVMEIDSQPDRMDLPDSYVREALKAGCKFSIATDAHSTGGLQSMRNGINIARRGWLERKDVINTRTEKVLQKWIKKHR